MKWHMSVAVIAVLCLGLFCGLTADNNQAQAQGRKAAPAEAKITVLNPLGTPPPVKLRPMAPRPATLEGKTLYVVDDGFIGGDNLLQEMVDWFTQNMPNTKAIYKRKGGMGFEAEDPKLWAEIKEKANAVIIGMGH
jgi:hypothetical protein